MKNPKLSELREQIAYLQDCLRDIHTNAIDEQGEIRSLDDDETVRFTEGKALCDSLITEAAALEQRLTVVESIADRPEARESGFAAPNVVVRDEVDVFDPDTIRSIGPAEAAKRYTGESRFLTDEGREELDRKLNNRDGSVIAPNDGIARHALAHGSPAYASAFAKLAKGAEWDLDASERAAISRAKDEERAMSLTDANGGFLVPTHLDPTVIFSGTGAIHPFRQISRTVTVTGDNWNGVTSTGVTASWDTEGAEVSDDAPTFAQPSITPQKGQAFVPVSYEALEDISNLGAEVASMFAEAKDTLEATAFATGTGTNQPNGIVTAILGSANDTAMATNSAFAVGDLFSAAEALPARYRGQNPVWVMNQVHINDVMEFGGTSYYTRSSTLDAGPAGSILGRPVYEASALSSTLDGDTNNNIVFGDFSNYVIVDRIGASVRHIPDLFATGNNRPSGQSGWHLHWRVGADSVNDTAFVLLYNPST